MTNIAQGLGVQEIIDLIKPGSRVLDIGCGQGDLLKRLIDEKSVQAMGVDIDEANVVSCVRKGIPVIHGNVDRGLTDPNKTYDYVVLSQTLQVLEQPYYVLKEMLRVGHKAILSFPNFGHWRLRFQLFFRGQMPKNAALGYEWYNTPNRHLSCIKDMRKLCKKAGFRVSEVILLKSAGRVLSPLEAFLDNWLAQMVIFVLEEQP